MTEPTDLCYYFKKTAQGNVASCMNSNWTKDRSKHKSTYALKYSTTLAYSIQSEA
jgi:hypothetical protein